jgi:hypothetical protein
MASITHYFTKTSSVSVQSLSKMAETIWPCPGLTKTNDPCIERFFERLSMMMGGGGQSIYDIAREKYNMSFRDLNDGKKQVVLDQNRSE